MYIYVCLLVYVFILLYIHLDIYQATHSKIAKIFLRFYDKFGDISWFLCHFDKKIMAQIQSKTGTDTQWEMGNLLLQKVI